MAASNAQVQPYSDQVVRPMAEKIRALKVAMEDLLSSIDDVYANLTDSPDWTDGRTDSPPHLLTSSDILGIHAFVSDVRLEMNGHGQLPIVLKACVRPIEVG
jgi:hypothetical protein